MRKRESMAYQRSMTQKKMSEKDGVPKKYDPKKESVKKKGAVIHLVHWSDQ